MAFMKYGDGKIIEVIEEENLNEKQKNDLKDKTSSYQQHLKDKKIDQNTN